ncbi:filament-like plant protein 3 [Phtheirospermum japonicum]|uniref:Filament-like plant protein 3 n=1 Tax=Phtheirospermum japonicum TaxID=374723 RepID=A0A830BRZ9_9LAMI|nr:filament-like plant protein 3 [Phtheirospermum japonicum]
MDRRSWLWRRKSSEKSPNGETESSGSISSHSERFSDDQALSNHNAQSPEVTSKAVQSDEHDDTVKTLSEKLSEALINIRAKDDLVKQHSKVAEEAVSGWEKAENEVLALKKQNEALTHKNSILDERVDHLDGALKECLRQLRQSRDEQEEKIQEWELNKSELENRLAELQTQLHLAKTDTNDALLVNIRSKLEALEKENSTLKLKVVSISKELDLSTRAAETASKQHLDSIKRVAKLESECLRLKAMARKANDSHSDSGSFKTSEESINNNNSVGKNLFGPSDEIDLMDDFLEMERLVAIPETRVPGERVELEENLRKVTAEKAGLEIALNECQMQLNVSEDRLGQTMAKLVDMKMKLAVADEAKRDTEREVELMRVKFKDLTELLDEKELTLVRSQDWLTKAEEARRDAEREARSIKVKLKNLTELLEEKELTLVRSQDRLTEAEEARRDAEKEAESIKVKLKDLTELLEEKELTLVRSQDQLTEAEEAKRRAEARLDDGKAEAESRIEGMEHELEKLRSGIFSLEKGIEREKSFSREAVAKCNVLEDEISRMKSDSDSQFQRSTIVEEFRINQDKELAVAASKFAECQKTIASLDRQLKSLATFEDFTIDDDE